jgi:NADH dehydrogenase FAD-containing subunit
MRIDGTTQVLIRGGGFGGLSAAMHLEKTLARGANVEVTRINRDNFFLFTTMLHEVAASDLDLTHIVNPVHKGSTSQTPSPGGCGARSIWASCHGLKRSCASRWIGR